MKSAYKALTWPEQSFHNQIHAAKLWHFKVPPFLLNFLWRTGKNILPSRERLVTRRVPIYDVCLMCHGVLESILHMLISCPYAKDVRYGSHLGWFNPHVSTFLEWSCAFLALFNNMDATLNL